MNTAVQPQQADKINLAQALWALYFLEGRK
jgi:hypothetical protein